MSPSPTIDPAVEAAALSAARDMGTSIGYGLIDIFTIIFWISVGFGILCGIMASVHGRDSNKAVLLGFFFWVIPALYYVFSSDTPELQAKKEQRRQQLG